MDKETLIQGLNQDLAHEYQAIIQYVTYAATVSGIHRGELKEFFLAEIQDELRHAQFLADKIARYVERMKQAEAYGDYGLANDLQEIISEETRHKEETEKLLKGTWQE